MEYLKLGYISGTFGFKGYFKLRPVADNVDIFFSIKELMLGDDHTPSCTFTIREIKEHTDCFVVKCDGVDSEQDALALKSLSVLIPVQDLPNPDDDEVYWYKINGSKVIDHATGNVIGTLVDYFESASADVFRIKLLDGAYAMISNNRNHVLNIDVTNRSITVDLMGLVSEEV